MNEETRVRMSFKQTAKGLIQMDLTTEAPTVDKASDLMYAAIGRFKEVAQAHKLTMTNE